MSVVCIIPARGGSKSIPGKNILDFCGKPLLAWSILQAIESSYVDEVYVSSDSLEILKVAEKYGAEGIERPGELATDTATSESVLIHALGHIENQKQKEIDLVVFLQATSPLREPEDIDGAIRKVLESESDSLLSVTVLDDLCAFKWDGTEITGITYDPFNRVRRQDRKPIYHDNGSIYAFRPEVLRKYKNRLGGKIYIFEMPFWKSYEIDTIADVDICKYYFERNLLDYWKERESDKIISAENVDLIAYDFDGVMTDNRVIVLEDGKEGIIANRADGLGIGFIKKMGIKQVIISTEVNPVVRARARKLELPVMQGTKDKAEILSRYCNEANLDMRCVVFVGNDLNDLEVMKLVGLPVAPFDAHPEVKRIARIILKSPGGAGVIREIADLIAQHHRQ